MANRRPLVQVSGRPAEIPSGDLIPIAALATGTPDGSKYVRDDGTLAVPPGGSASDMLGALLFTEVAVTGATTAVLSKWHKISGTSADYTITLPTAVGNAGKCIGFYVDDFAHATKKYTLDANGSEKIDTTALTVGMCWKNSLILISDNVGWHTVAAVYDNDWQFIEAFTITGTSSNPTKSTVSGKVDKLYVRRCGRSTFQIKGEYWQSAGTGGAAGSGDYLYVFPFNLLFDTTVFNNANSTLNNRLSPLMGTSWVADSNDEGIGSVIPYSTTQFRLYANYITSSVIVGSANFDFAAQLNVTFDFDLPVSGWA